MSQGDTSASARRWRLEFWTVFGVVAVGTVLAMWQIAVAYHPEHIRWMGERYDTIDLGIKRIRELPAASPRKRLIYLGDSTVTEYVHGPALSYLTTQALNLSRRYPWVNFGNAAAPGAGISQYGFLADHIADADPDLIIWQLSYFHFTDRWTSLNGSPELVGFVQADRLPEILAMPLEVFNLSLSDVVLQQAIVRLGLHRAHKRVRKTQLRFGRMRGTVEEWLNPNRGRRPEQRAQRLRGTGYMTRYFDAGIPDRYSANGERAHFGRTLQGLEPDDPKLRLLRSGLQRLVAGGSDVLVYMNPTNLDNLRALGLEHEAGLERTLYEIERVVVESGARFLDLTELLPDADYEDAAGHFVEDEKQNVPHRIAKIIADEAKPILEARPRRAPGEAD